MRKWMPRMYVRFYLALLACLLMAVLLFVLLHVWYDPYRNPETLAVLGEQATKVLPSVDDPHRRGQRVLQRWRQRYNADLSLYYPDGTLAARAGHPLPPPDLAQAENGPLRNAREVYAIRLDDGRWLLARRTFPHRTGIALGGLSLMIAVVIAIGAYPVVRRITGRLERLQTSVKAWGDGKLSSRVAVEGNDEVAQLAESFNASAARIEALVGAQKTLLANASHELRSPLARIRMAVELMQDSAQPAISAELKRNIGELDQLIEELLLASRLDAAPDAVAADEVDLAALSAEECARTQATLESVLTPVLVRGDARLLRRVVRNLLENAQRYGEPDSVVVRLGRAGDRVTLDVCDNGPGVPEQYREDIFTPFYRLPGASEKSGGVGLGLALVRQIVRKHGGEVVCLPNHPQGACFRVTLTPA
jgi:signal transduction histidine kinase